MDQDEFSRKVKELRARVEAKLERRSTAGAGPSRAEALAELNTCLEELTVAEEELRQQNEELAAARHRYQELFDFAPDPYLVSDPDGKIQEANRAAAKLLQIPAQFIVGKLLLQYVAKEEHEAFMNQLARLRTGAMEKVEGWEITIQPRAGGDSLRVAVTVGAVRDRFSRLAGLRWLMRAVPSQVKKSG